MPDLSTIISNVSELVPMLVGIAQFFAAVLGATFCGQSLYKFYQASSETGQPVRVSAAIMYALSGVALINLAGSIDVVFDVLFGSEHASTRNLMSYQGSSRLPESGVLMLKGLILLIQLYGLFFVVSGFSKMRKLSDGQAANDVTPASVLYRVFGGALLLNIVLTVNTLAGIAGFGRVL